MGSYPLALPTNDLDSGALGAFSQAVVISNLNLKYSLQ